jgi:hypothetical protein
MLQIKKCSQCKRVKDVNYFWWRKDHQNYRANCKECCSKFRKKYYKNNKKTLLIWHKKYRLENRDKIIKQQKESYYRNNGAEKRKEWRNKNPLRDLKTNKKWRLNNPKKIKEINKKRWQKIINDPILHEKNKLQVRLKMSTLKAKLRQRKSFKKHFLANREYYLKKNKDHYIDNKLYYNLKSIHRRKHILIRIPKWANLEKIREIYKKSKKGYHVDHIIPLQGKNVSGLHVENNLRIIKATRNLSKGNKFPYNGISI